ncbi:hypothetical protein NPIL_344621 [Nephila pilipes]|uniref:Uncharacterized protein n=1 Tax=Nephila pilipes TaxID=299642 RepID=A0A8X6QK12_NEPPI|nr:hypothetical protein NPIL_344621 [Nephila pilipes]
MIFAFVASSVELDKRTYASDSYARLVWFAMETKGEPTTRCGDDSAFLLFCIDDVLEKIKQWKLAMPRVTPYYGEFKSDLGFMSIS